MTITPTTIVTACHTIYDCPCGAVLEFSCESASLEDYAALNRWLGTHVTGGCGARS